MTTALEATDTFSAMGATAPRVSLADIENAIEEIHYVTGDDAVAFSHNKPGQKGIGTLSILTLCLIVMKNGFIVMCEVLLPDMSPHPSNFRATIDDDPDLWIGFEQEYFLMENGRPLGFPEDGFPGPQGPYYCGVGNKDVGDIARQFVDEHLEIVLDAGINPEGINAEVAKGQWEFQIFSPGAKKVCDDLWVARYLLLRTAEKYGLDIEFHCKPISGDWNGSGMHTNFSTKFMREEGGEPYFKKLMDAFEKNCNEHIAAYGPDNHLRLTGLHETQSIDKFNWGVANRGASIRVPHSFVNNGYKGYLEDRRPNSQADPYKIVSRILKTINEVS